MKTISPKSGELLPHARVKTAIRDGGGKERVDDVQGGGELTLVSI